jgi:hypothetical protein
MRVAQVSRPEGPFEIVERPIPEPGPGTVRITVRACGICHSDSVTKEGLFPNIPYPRVPGHEVAGVIDAVGPRVPGWQPGQNVGVGWNGGFCGYCDHCRHGEFFACARGPITGVTYDGGYAEYTIAPASAVALMPADLPPVEAAPLRTYLSPGRSQSTTPSVDSRQDGPSAPPNSSTPSGTRACRSMRRPRSRNREGCTRGRRAPEGMCRIAPLNPGVARVGQIDTLAGGLYRYKVHQGVGKPDYCFCRAVHRRPGQRPIQNQNAMNFTNSFGVGPPRFFYESLESLPHIA